MTSIAPYEVACPLCSHEHEQLVLESTSSFGPPDLDSRPAPLAREAFIYDAAECPACGFVFTPRPTWATELVQEVDPLHELLASPEYRDAYGLQEAPERFRRLTLIAHAQGFVAEAGWAALRGAWLCDDDADRDGARRLRLVAVGHFRAAEAKGDEIIQPPEMTALLLADVLRRAECFDEALSACDRAEREVREPELRPVVAQERSLILARDTEAHVARAGS